MKYNVVVLGGGPGGYVAAIRAAQVGKKVAIVEANHLGGICLNWGCIPTKALLKNAEVFDLVKNANKYGIEVGEVTVNWGKMIKRSRDVAKRLSKGIEFLMKKNKIDYIPAFGKLLNGTTIEATDADGNIIIADTIVYNKPEEFLIADGNVKITDKEGNLLLSEKATFDKIGYPLGYDNISPMIQRLKRQQKSNAT